MIFYVGKGITRTRQRRLFILSLVNFEPKLSKDDVAMSGSRVKDDVLADQIGSGYKTVLWH